MKAIKILFTTCVALIIAAYVGDYARKEYLRNQLKDSLARISLSEVQVIDANIDTNPKFDLNGSRYDISGKLINNSNSFPIEEVGILVTALDCSSTTSCLNMGQDNVVIRPMVPAGQARTFNGSAIFSGANSENLQFKYEISYVCSGLCPSQTSNFNL